MREARAVAGLAHPNVHILYDVGRHDDWHYLVLECSNSRFRFRLDISKHSGYTGDKSHRRGNKGTT
jgi:hypothetical protein